MVKEHCRLEVDRWAKVEPSKQKIEFVDQQNNISDISGQDVGLVLAAAECRAERGGTELSALSSQLLADLASAHSPHTASMNVLKKIKARIGLSHKQAGFSPPAQPLEFHPVHGDNVMLSANNTIAAR